MVIKLDLTGTYFTGQSTGYPGKHDKLLNSNKKTFFVSLNEFIW